MPALDVLMDLEQQLTMFDIPNLPEDFPFPAIEWIGNAKGITFFKPMGDMGDMGDISIGSV